MELRLERLWPKETYTIGRLYINNEFFCNTLEDRIVDKNKNGIFDNGEKKVYGESAIPYGTYNISDMSVKRSFDTHLIPGFLRSYAAPAILQIFEIR